MVIHQKKERMLSYPGECRYFPAHLESTAYVILLNFAEMIRGVSLHGREGRYLVYPVEYKKGQPKEDEADILQMAAGLCVWRKCWNVRLKRDIYFMEKSDGA